jgi:site-specific recombinase XerC
MADMQGTWKPGTCSLVYRALQQFFVWMVREEEIDRSPRERKRAPRVPERPVPVPTDQRNDATCSLGAQGGPSWTGATTR